MEFNYKCELLLQAIFSTYQTCKVEESFSGSKSLRELFEELFISQYKNLN